jgi:HSP20 family protein
MEEIFSRYRRLIPTNGEKTEGISVDWQPVADISETEKEYLIKAELPEVERKDVHVAIDNGRITISGERRMDKEEEDTTQLRIESFYGTFSRSFTLPDNVDESKITAESKDGILKVHLLKSKVTKSTVKEVPVQ